MLIRILTYINHEPKPLTPTFPQLMTINHHTHQPNEAAYALCPCRFMIHMFYS
jgi:hypothetical protein